MFNFIADKLHVKNLGELLAPTLTPEQELHAAIEQGLTDKLLCLLDEEHVDPNAKNDAGNLPIHTAAYHGCVEVLTILLTHNVDVNAPCPRQNSPLHYAAAQNREEAVRFLVDNGANPALRNRSGRTPYDVAKGDNIRQYLLPLQFRHEDPTQAAAQLPPGITPSADPMAPRPVIAPPPLSGDFATMPSPATMAPPQQQMPQNNLYAAATHSAIPRGGPSRFARPKDYRPIQADGFGSSVGNDELSAKFGNTREVKVTAPPPAAMVPLKAAPTESVAVNSAPAISTGAGANPYASTYTTKPQTSLTGCGYPGQALPGAVARGPPQFKIFNPTAVPVAAPATLQPPAFGSGAALSAPVNPLPSYMATATAPVDVEELQVSTTDSVLQ